MLKTQLTHPDILAALARAGHRSTVLIADGNYPFATRVGPNAARVSLNLSPGIVSATDVLRAILTATPIERAAAMAPEKLGPYAMKKRPAIFNEFDVLLRAAQSPAVTLIELERFYEEACSPDVALAIATGEKRVYGNLLLTVGVVESR